MRILLLEDRGDRRLQVIKQLKAWNHEVFECQTVSEANDIWKKEKDTLDCLIVDLAMPPKGLNNEEDEKKTCGGYFTGWVWLTRKVFPDDRRFVHRSIAFSAWIEEFLKKRGADIKKEDFPEKNLLRKRLSWEEDLKTRLDDIAALA